MEQKFDKLYRFAVWAWYNWDYTECIGVGRGNISQMCDLPTALASPRFRDAYERNGCKLRWQCVAMFETFGETKAFYDQVFAAYAPTAKPGAVSKGFVRCNNDGKIYRSSGDASKAYGIAPSSMSNHLVGRQGYNTVHGMSFERLPALPAGSIVEVLTNPYAKDPLHQAAIERHRMQAAALPTPTTPPIGDEPFDTNQGMDAIEAAIRQEMMETFRDK